MITVPLADVVAFLQRHGVPLGVLEGAPLYYGWTGAPVMLMGYPGRGDAMPSANAELYIGRSEVCPAAMGWATALLIASRSLRSPACWLDDGHGAWCRSLGDQRGGRHDWYWSEDQAEGVEMPMLTRLAAETPPTPAERLRAVLVYEMGRAMPEHDHDSAFGAMTCDTCNPDDD